MAVLFPKSLIESAAPELLIRALGAFPAWLARTGCDALPTSKTAREAWSVRIYRALNAGDRKGDALHVEVRGMLARIGEMANDEGRDRLLVALGAERAMALSGMRLTDFELALTAYCNHVQVFELAYARKSSTEAVRFVEFFPSRYVPLVGHHDLDKQRQMRDAIAAYYRQRGNTACAQIDVEETEEEVRILVLHGRSPREFNVIDDDEELVRVRQVHDKHDLIVIDKESGRLGINAQFSREEAMLRALVGSVFFNDPVHYSNAAIYTGAPLIDYGLEALSTAGIAGLAAVRLRGVRISARGGKRRIEWTDQDDMSDELDEQYMLDRVQHGEILAIHFGITHSGESASRRLILVPPNKIYLDRRLGDVAVRGFLQRRRFADYPPLPRLPRAA